VVLKILEIRAGIYAMIGAIAGDMIGSPYEGRPTKSPDFPIRVAGFTDDTVLTVAVAYAILADGDYAASINAQYRLS
jgi:ADP-ribosylglycohydrolase